MLNIIASMAVMPNRFLVKLDANNDYFKTYQYQLGVLRLNVEKATGFADPKKGKLLTKLMRDAPDCYCEVKVAAEDEWKTSTKKNATNPEWNETRDFLVTDYDQCIAVDVRDDDFAGDDHLGFGLTSIKQILLAGGKEELSLTKKGESTPIKLSLSCQFYQFVTDVASFTTEGKQDKEKICGLVTILVAGVFGIQGRREELNPSVKVSWGHKSFRTPAKTDAPGTDISNPSFDSAFRIPITAELADSPAAFKFTLMNKNDEVGHAEVPFADVLAAPDLILQSKFDIGSGAAVNASICVRGTKLSNM
jgi:Ca2+-dependent lipid-binding protein